MYLGGYSQPQASVSDEQSIRRSGVPSLPAIRVGIGLAVESASHKAGDMRVSDRKQVKRYNPIGVLGGVDQHRCRA
jgi:hypothetical protein